MFDICCIGHITSDRIVTPGSEVHMPGGTAYYFSHAVRNMGLRYLLVTALADADKPYVHSLEQLGIEVVSLPSRHTVCFENIYSQNQDHRIQKVSRQADPFMPEYFSEVHASVFHLGTLLADDMPPQLITALASRAEVSLDVQGMLRTVVNGRVEPVDWAGKTQLLPFISYLKANEEEAEVLTGSTDPYKSARLLAKEGVREVILTLGSKGSLVYSNGVFHTIPAYPPASVVDATGCGDTYMAGYLAQRKRGAGIPDAGRFAAAMATIKIQSSGPFSAPVAEAEKWVHGITS